MVIHDKEFHSFGNGDIEDEWEKQTLIKDLTEHAFDVYQYVTQTKDLFLLKNLLFKVAECNRSHWVSRNHEAGKIWHYRNHENYEHSSIFVEKHLLHSGDSQREDFYGTVSSTLFLLTDTNMLYAFERIYDHTQQRTTSTDQEHTQLLLNFDHAKLLD